MGNTDFCCKELYVKASGEKSGDEKLDVADRGGGGRISLINEF
jgi:hypothetical protein